MEQQQEPESVQLQRQIEAVESRRLHLWDIGLLMLAVVAAGFVALLVPNIAWNTGEVLVDRSQFPQLFYGFIVLVILFNVYAVGQRRVLHSIREELVRQLIRSAAAEKLSLVDPLTEVFNRRYLQHLLPKEIARADRRESKLALMMIDVDAFKSVNTRFGHLVGDQVLVEVARLLNRTFRASDTVVRYGGDEFLVVMSHTDERQAEIAAKRVLSQVDNWNAKGQIAGYRMGLSCGVTVYSKGQTVKEVLEAADQKMYQHKVRPSRIL
jgi:diguanylate cyclase (GGDEF)-like protein